MRCFSFSGAHKKDEPKTGKSISTPSSTSLTDHDQGRRSGSESNSQTVSDTSTESSSVMKISFTDLSQRPSNLRVFSFEELKTVTRNFSRSVMIGEGGFGGVYRGIIKDTEDSNKKIDIAVKQLSRRGLQVRFSTLFVFFFFRSKNKILKEERENDFMFFFFFFYGFRDTKNG